MKRLNEEKNDNNKKAKYAEKYEDMGIIVSVCLKNFMCHDHLKFDFDPRINFIIGQNGSGKSAVLTGIILALGGKSGSTGRYSNIKGFIKTGKQKAYLSVVLRNGGDFAYKPEIYGDRITVEREISIEGVSSYKIKSDGGRIISTLREEVNNILNAMDIQIENPVLVLTQETSRNFLMSKHGKEEKLYEFFYKGTGLQLLEENYQHASGFKDEATNDLMMKQQALPGMEKEIDRWKNLLDSSAKVGDLKNELGWANVQEMEKRVEENKKAVHKVNKDLASSKVEAEKCKVVYNEWCLKLEQHLKERVECDSKMTLLRKSLSELATQREACAEKTRTSQGAVDLHRRQEKKLLEDITVLEKSIKENQIKNQTNFEEKKREQDEKIKRLEAQNLEAATKQKCLQKENDRLFKEKNEAQEQIDVLKAEMNDFEYKKQAISRSIQQLKIAIKNKQILFGEHTTNVLAEIQRRKNEFIQMPRGPVGLYVEVKDPKWNNAVETCLKQNMLRSFCCDNAKDSTVLTDILKKFYRGNIPSVIVSKFLPEIHDVTRYKAKSQYPTVYDMLLFKDPVIANCLIDQTGIENVILIENISIAHSIMLDHPPQYCRSSFLLNCDEILLNPYRHYSATRKITNPMLQTISQDTITSKEESYWQISEEFKAKEKQAAELNSKFQQYPLEIRKIDREIVDLSSYINRNASRISDLKQYEEPKDISGMLDDLESLKSELQEKQEQLEASEQQFSIDREKYEEVNQNLQEQKALLSDEKSVFDELGKKVNVCGQKKEILASSKKQFVTSIKEFEKESTELEARLKESITATQAAIDSANKVGDRIMTTRNPDEIRIQIQETEKVIQESSNCDRTDLFNKWKEKHQKLIQAKADLKRIENHTIMLGRMLKKREKKLKEIIKHTQHCLDLAFTVVLKGNRFSGRLDFSKSGALKLEATPKQGNLEGGGGKKKCSSLSGGERSFVTIAFLLALWDRIKMPFRILDEYDVFMDSNNRNLSINLLIKRADFMKNVQFIFLSPLELPEMKESENIKVHKMPAPKRMGLIMED